jgi:hypothetical protein
MLFKEAAIAVAVAVMLAGASLFGGIWSIPAFAAIDPNSVLVAKKEVSQDDHISMIIDSLELTAKKSTLRASGTLTVEIIQNDAVLRSASLGTFELDTSFQSVELDINNINVTGSFEILVTYLGSGLLTVSEINVLEGTEAATTPPNTPPATPPNTPPATPPNTPPATPPNTPPAAAGLENVIASKTISQGTDDRLTVKTVEFSARKSTLRATGTLIIAIVQGNQILGSDSLSTSELGTSLKDLEVTFGLVVKDDFRVVFMYEGSGWITINAIRVPGEIVTPPTPPPVTPPSSGTIQLVVNAVDQSGNKVGGLYVAVLQGLTLVKSGGTEATFTLDKGKVYTVEMGDYYNNHTATFYDFNGWTDNTQSKTRTATLNANEGYTAKYIVTIGAPPPPPPSDPPATPPSSSPSGTITAFAYRIPDEHWGGTFVNAKAQMYFVLYNSTGYMIYGGYYDENGNKVTGLKDGQTYWIYATNCHHCHGGMHDVVFNHWENSSTKNPRAVTPGTSVGAYYEYVPDTP